MDNVLAYYAETVTLHAVIQDKNEALVDQTGGYPKITIQRMDAGGPVVVVNAVTMTEDIDGEYYYRWTAPSMGAEYKVKYEGLIDGQSVYGWDTVTVRIPTNEVYTVEGIGDRFDIVEGAIPTLQAQVYQNGVAFDVYQVARVEIYNDRTEADKDYGVGVPLETIATGNISQVATGRYEYALTQVLSTANLYYDKVYIIPKSGDSEQSFVLPFYVRKTSVGSSPPGDMETCEIKFNLFELDKEAKEGDLVEVRMNEDSAYYDNNLVDGMVQSFYADSDGIVTMNLIETTTLTQDTGKQIYYNVRALSCNWERNILVPKSTFSADLFDLPVYTA